MKKNILRVFLAAAFIFGATAMNAQAKFYVYKNQPVKSVDEYNIVDVDSINFTLSTVVTPPVNALITYPVTSNPIVWGYDVKNPAAAQPSSFTSTLANNVFKVDGMTVIRVPIFLNYYDEATRTVIPTNTKVKNAMDALLLAKQTYPAVKVFASLKIEGVNGTSQNGNEGTFPDWAYTDATPKSNNPTQGSVKVDVYIDMLANYLLYMKDNGITIDYLGIDNEPEHSCSGFPYDYNKYIQVLDGLQAKSVALNFTMPAQFIAPEPLGPKQEHIDFVTDMVANRGDLITIVGTHYYPVFRWGQANGPNALPNRLKAIVQAGQGRPLWQTEAHYDALDQVKPDNKWTELDRANQFMVTNFDCYDLNCNGYMMWAYQRNDTDLKGSVSRELAQSTAGFTHALIDINAAGTRAPDYGFSMRAFVKDKTVAVWILNMRDPGDKTNLAKTNYTLAVNGKTVNTIDKYLVWTDASWNSSPYSASNGSAAASGDKKYVILTIPDRSMALLKFTID